MATSDVQSQVASADSGEWTVFSDATALAEGAANRINQLAAEAIVQRGCFRIVLAGGRTPEICYRELSKLDSQWSKWHLFLGDERFLPPLSHDLNSQMITRSLLSSVPIPESQINFMDTAAAAEKCAAAYQKLIEAALPFDLVVLGVGEDGHTASLFPGACEPPDVAESFVVYDAPKPPATRLTLSTACLSKNRNLMFLVSGSDKQDALKGISAGEELPVTQISSESRPEFWVDQAAAGDLL